MALQWPSSDIMEEIGQRSDESLGEAINIHEAGISCPSFDVAQVGPVQPGSCGQILLSQSEFFAAMLDRDSKTVTNIRLF